jgi:hypothetical protein
LTWLKELVSEVFPRLGLASLRTFAWAKFRRDMTTSWLLRNRVHTCSGPAYRAGTWALSAPGYRDNTTRGKRKSVSGMAAKTVASQGSPSTACVALRLRLKVCGRARLVTSPAGSRFIAEVTGDVQRTARNVNGGLLRPYSESIVYAYALFNEWNGVHVAQKIQTLFIDDIDGSEAEGTVRFALDGAEYEIDLNAKHAEALRKALARYVDAARRSSGGAARRPARSGRRTAASGLNTTEVREWAKAQGIEVKDRGRVPAELVVRFRAATGN